MLQFDMRSLFVILLALFLAACGGNDVPCDNHHVDVIAHAGGVAGGYVYTNSREALQRSLRKGYRYIEFDFLFTADSVLVAAHDWESFNKRTGFAHKGTAAPTYAEFKACRIDGCFTPLSATEINEVFESDTTIYLVTDKESSPQVLEKYFPRLKNRMVVEAFSYSDYTALLGAGYHRVHYSCLATDIVEGLFKHLLLPGCFSGPRIEWITMYEGELDNIIFRIIDAFASFKMALFTVNDYFEVPPSVLPKVGMVYSDIMDPDWDYPSDMIERRLNK